MTVVQAPRSPLESIFITFFFIGELSNVDGIRVSGKGVCMRPCARYGREDVDSLIESEKLLVVGEICIDM